MLPVYNGQRYIHEAVSSIQNQSFQDFELLIVDDGSTDDTPAILQEFARRDDRVRLYHQENSGLISSLNRMCRVARGLYIARMDADDISMPNRLRRQIDYLNSHSDVGIVGAWMQDMRPDGSLGPVWPLPSRPATVRWFLMFGNCISHPSVMMRRPLIERLGYYRSEALHVEDYDLWMRASSVTGLANIPEVLLRYRVSGDSISGHNLPVQHQQAAKLQCAMVSSILKRPVSEIPLGPHDLLDLYAAYRKAGRLDRGDDSEIVADIVRRLLLSRSLLATWMPLVPLMPRLLSIRNLRNAVRLGTSYMANASRGFITSRSARFI